MSQYIQSLQKIDALCKNNPSWSAISAESVARIQLQNRFNSGVDIARYTASIIRKDMQEYDKDSSKYTRSLGCWHGFVAQQKMIGIKRHFHSTNKRYLYLSGWMVAAMRSEFGPLPDQSMHEKTAVSSLISEIYDFLKQADARELNHLFNQLDQARADKNEQQEQLIINSIDNFCTHVVPIIADIDAGFGNEEATYLLAKKMIAAGAGCIQIENQVSDAKQCGHQDGKVTVPHEDFLSKINAVRYAFLELGVDDGVIVARTDSLGAGLTQKIPISKTQGDLADQYNSFLEATEVAIEDVNNSDVLLKRNDQLVKPTRLSNGLYKFRENTNEERVVLDCITSLRNGADLLWIETEQPHIGQIKHLVDQVREQVPNAKLVYNNSPSFNWTLNFRQQVYDGWQQEGRDLSQYQRGQLMDVKYDDSELSVEADRRIKNFQHDSAHEAGVFHHLITLPTYHTSALSTDNLAQGYFGDEGMLAYVAQVQRQEIRGGLDCVKHQDMAGSGIGDTHKEYFCGEHALKAGGGKNTMNQF